MVGRQAGDFGKAGPWVKDPGGQGNRQRQEEEQGGEREKTAAWRGLLPEAVDDDFWIAGQRFHGGMGGWDEGGRTRVCPPGAVILPGFPGGLTRGCRRGVVAGSLPKLRGRRFPVKEIRREQRLAGRPGGVSAQWQIPEIRVWDEGLKQAPGRAGNP